MSSYFISPPGESDLKIDADQFVDYLRTQWAAVEVRTIESAESYQLLEWTAPMEHGIVVGSLDRTGQVVDLDGDVRDCARFAIAFRAWVPTEYKLIFYDEGYSADVELGTETSKAQLVEPFLAET